ncbi:MAG: sel1 repeat family protein [Pseudomonadota bacterium]
MRYRPPLILAVTLSASVLAQAPDTIENEFGILNPPDTGREMLVRKIEMGGIDSVSCSLAFNNTKYDNLPLARKLATRCAEAGITKAMTWMSYLESNGLGAEANPEAAAEWDRRAADAGDPVGMYNFGLDLIRGHGVAQDETLGRRYIDRAASEGLEIAKELQAADYDLEIVTPDADNWE